MMRYRLLGFLRYQNMPIKIRSQALWDYLSRSGVLATGDDEAIRAAKKEWRRLQKKLWKRKNDEVVRELRPRFTVEEMVRLKSHAKRFGLTPTIYLKKTALSAIEGNDILPDKSRLYSVLQGISMAINKTEHFQTNVSIQSARELLLRSESLLTNYLNSNQ